MSSPIASSVAHTHGSTQPVTLVVRLVAAAATEGRLVGHAQVVSTGELVPITGSCDLEQLARRLAEAAAAESELAGAELAPG